MLRIGKQLRRLRVERGLTHLQLANATGLTQTAISRLETNASSPSGTNLAKIADFFGVPMDALRDDERAAADAPNEIESRLIDAARKAQAGDVSALAEMRRLYAKLGEADAARTERDAAPKSKSTTKKKSET